MGMVFIVGRKKTVVFKWELKILYFGGAKITELEEAVKTHTHTHETQSII